MIRKFYDAQLAEPAAAPPPSIASMMAKDGIKSSGSTSVSTPINIQPEKKEEPVPEPAKVEPTGTTPTEPAKPEPPAQPQEPAKPTAPIEPVQPKVPTLQEVLKNHQPDAVLKELGYDDSIVALINGVKGADPKMLALLNYWKQNGDISPYAKALSTDYSKMSAEDVMKHQLREDYPGASSQQIEALFKREVIKAYSLDSDDEAEAAEGRLLLEAKADKSRAALITKQQDYLVPKPPEPKPAEPDLVAQKQAQDFELYQENVNNSPFTKSMLTNKQLVIGEGETAYKHLLADPQLILNSLFDPTVYAKSFFTKETKPDGSSHWTPDVEKQLFIHAALTDWKGLQKGLADHYISIGKNAAIAPIDNAKDTSANLPATPAQALAKNAAESMARQGSYNSGGR